MTKRKTVKTIVGKNLVQILGDTSIKDWYAAVSEFVCNSYDADAENVYISVNPNQGTLTIKDDGSGMDEKGLKHFFRLGDSQKIEEPLSPIKKRIRVGKKGIAKTLLRYLGNSFSLESVCNGDRYFIDEGISEGDISGVSLLADEGMSDGTTLTIRKLRFEIGENGFDMDRLMNRLSWDVPNKPDFDVFVNSKLVKKRGLVEYARVYGIDHEIDSGKRITGRIYFNQSKKGAVLDGVRIYVNGRAVGDDSLFDLRNIGRRLLGRIQGEVNADFLEPFITLDRSSFQDNPDLESTIEHVNSVLYSIDYDIDMGSSRRAYYQSDRSMKVVEDALLEAQEQLNSKLEREYTLELTANDRAGPVSRLDNETSTIAVNAGNNFLTFCKEGQRQNLKLSEMYMKRAFLVAAAHAITKDACDEDERISELVADHSKDAFQGYKGIVSIAGKFLKGKLLIPVSDIYLNQHRLYDHLEVSTITGRPANIIRLMHNSGALPGSAEHLFSKDDLLGILNPLEGYVSCIEAVDKSYGEVNLKIGGHIEIRYDYPRATSLDTKLKETDLEDFDILNIGIAHPLYFISREQTERFARFVEKNKLNTLK